ncbi:UDP-GlcNAc:betaGal beta-1,3-N-acetylglucosaminyltransferase-like protein 1 isoform X6 [Lemur catta]|uniref:UDP-GlcNAc:betaGal beta-1,3-N-acetylglucosaminyltransferase-like protein 1 isoform X6 n=1 Tax=Lemur catta TaxID=9447 RepID=UPI001E266877|nr:UDP-GlcNAc:betaGal beta-1,3-N-acetylglucosaminyltransferase-like protein 1 isoform X6 [Lemur catta]XP_045381767.1 UDP-GlcNAc:betaGal beta-1,3-N-acetylglucosaminyltransferase-like protein 1 isoform X6 [Lemur catta]XP_045381768.1 UDP-GlcNAc:betaGal beta-1,3-N-acetylglucosaminyltransferase-like protein 1 isoform X6 [Lemur catta]
MQAAGDPAPGPGPRVSIILPVHNAEPWLDECLNSVLQQDFEGTMELSVFNDASKDKSGTIIEKWKVKLEASGILVVIGGHDSPSPRGVGYSKNQAIAQSSGSYLCFLDSDDVMMSQRVRLQHEAAVQHPTSGGGISPWEGGHVTEGDLQPIVGCRVRRDPPESTGRYTRWINRLTPDQLLTQVFTSNGPTVIMPTWFCSRAWFSHVGRFDEGGQGHGPLLCPGPRSGPTASASWRSAPCRAGPPSPSGTRAGRAAGCTAASAPPAGARWSRSATWTRTRSRRASTATRTLRNGPSPGCPSCTSEQRGRPSSSA